MNMKQLVLDLVNHPRWRWLAGMRALYGDSASVRVLEDDEKLNDGRAKWPDLADPATVGCLLHLLALAYPCFELRVEMVPDEDVDEIQWRLYDANHNTEDTDKYLGVVVAVLLLDVWNSFKEEVL